MPVVPSQPRTPADFWAILSRSRLFDAARLAELKAGFEAASPDATAEAAARWLGSRKLITAWQARRLLRGEHGPFVIGDYRLLERLEGDEGAVLLRAVHVPSAKTVVIALLAADRCRNVEAWTGIVRRTALAHQAANPMLSKTFSLEQCEGNRFIVCEDVVGPSLRNELAKRGALPAAEAGWLAASLARAVAEVHAAGAVHGGISLDTLLRETSSGAVRLLQFPRVGDPHASAPRLALERPDAVKKLGTRAAFIAPECILGGGGLGPPADVYAIGCVLASLLTARLSCWKGDAASTLAEAAAGGFRPPRPPEVPLEVETLIGYLTARDPSARYPSAAEAADAIAACFGFPRSETPAAVSAPPAGPVPAAAALAPAFPEDALATPIPDSGPAAIVRPTSGPNEATRRARRRMAILRGLLAGIGAIALVGIVGAIAVQMGGGTPRPKPHPTQAPPSHAEEKPNPPPMEAKEREQTPADEAAIAAVPDREGGGREAGAAIVPRDTVVLVDDPKLVWDSPTHGPPADLSFLPPGSQVMLVARIASLVASDEGAKLLAALGPSVGKAVEAAAAIGGCGPEGIERLLAGWQADEKGSLVAGYAFDLQRPLGTEANVPLSAWGTVTAEERGDGETVYRGAKLAFWLPKARGGRTLVVAPVDVVGQIIESNGEPPLTPDLARLAERLDGERQVILFGSPSWFGGDGRDLLTGPLARLAEPLADLFGPEVGAASLSLHVGTTGYVELMALPRADTTASTLAASLAANLDTMPERIERYCTALDPHPFGRTIVLRLAPMMRALHANLRHGAEAKIAILNCHLPAAAPHNIALAGELALEQAPATTAVAATTAKPEAAGTGLQKRLSLSFPRDTLERSLQMLSDEIGVPIEILGGDLQLDGITKNQSFALDERDVTGESILRTILAKADSGGRLIYVVREKDGEPAIEVTTRAAAAKRGDTLPPGFEEKKK